jgi:hypothetical protein
MKTSCRFANPSPFLRAQLGPRTGGSWWFFIFIRICGSRVALNRAPAPASGQSPPVPAGAEGVCPCAVRQKNSPQETLRAVTIRVG